MKHYSISTKLSLPHSNVSQPCEANHMSVTSLAHLPLPFKIGIKPDISSSGVSPSLLKGIISISPT